MISKIGRISFLFLVMLSIFFGLSNLKIGTYAAIGDSGVVVEESEDIATTLLNGITLHEQTLGFYEDGNKLKYNIWTTQYLEMAPGNPNNKIVSWSYRDADAWRKNGVTEIAKDFEKNNPGWIVVGGTNNDFFAINSTNSSGEMDYNAMENGELIKSRNDITYYPWRGILGFNDKNELVEGAPTVTPYYNVHIYEDSSMLDETGVLQADHVNPETKNNDGVRISAPVSETGITVLTKDVIGLYDLTGYKVVVGKYDITRIGYSNGSMLTANGFNIYVKGEIVEMRQGTTGEKPEDYRTIEDRTVSAKEFYLVSKDGSLDSLEIGDYVKVQKDYTGNFEDVENAVSYYWKILEDGDVLFEGIDNPTTRAELAKEYAGGDFSYITAHKARCLFGLKADGSYVMAVIDGTSSTGTTLSEAATYMKELGCVDAWNFDGGGSATLVARGENNSIKTINTPSDSGGASERLVGNAILMVVRDPGFESSLRYSTATTVTLTKKTTSDIFQNMDNIKMDINGRTIDVSNDQQSVIIDDLLPGQKYPVVVSYTYEGVEYSATMFVETKEYKPGVSFTPMSDGFIVRIDSNTDEVLKTIGVNITVDDKTYTMNEIDEFAITGLLLNQTYNINYSYTVKNIKTNSVYTLDAPSITISTLSYQTPVIDYFEEYSLKNDTLRIKYSYSDNEGLLTDAYVLVNGVRDNSLDVSSDSGLLTIRDLELELSRYTYQLILEYDTPSLIPKKIYSDILTYGTDSCNHIYDNDCDNSCNICSEIRNVEHEYSNATCEAPATCTVCGETQGSIGEHNYSNATCEAPATCTICGATIGEKLEHSWQDATTDAPATCTICGATIGEKLDEKGCKGCKKSTLSQLILGISALAGTILIFRKRK